MHLPSPFSAASFGVRPYVAGDEASMFTVSASLNAAEASDLMDWTRHLEAMMEAGALAWVAARGKRVNGFAVLAPVPGLPGVGELTGGVAPPWQSHGIGARLLEAVQGNAHQIGVRRLSCFVIDLESDASRFLLNRSFTLEHEECLLELDLAKPPQTIAPPDGLTAATLPRDEAIAQFLRVYERSFAGKPWSQPYSVEEVSHLLERPEDLLFAMKGDEAVGVAWVETGQGGYGRIEPFGIAAEYQSRGVGRWLLQEALARLRGRGLHTAQLGLWRDNAVARHLYERAGFVEVSNWYYLAQDLP